MDNQFETGITMNHWKQGFSLRTQAAVAASALALIALIAHAAAEQKSTPTAAATAAKPALTVATTQPTLAQWPIKLSANGTIAAWQEAIVGAESNGLRLSDVRVNVGDVVKRGQILATFAADTIQAELAQQSASIAEAEAALAEAQANAARARTLQDSGAMPAQQIDQYLTAEKTARARLGAANALAQSVRLRLGFTRVVAPDDGIISNRSATVGAVVGAGQELFRLIRKNRLEWRGEVTASELMKVQIGQVVTLTTPDNSAVGGKVRMIAPTVDAQTRNALVYVDLERSAHTKAGMFAKGDFAVGGAQALSVPQQAVFVRDGFSYVMRMEAGNKVALRKVQLGRRVADRIEVIDGLKTDDVIVGSGAAFLTDGDTVRVASAAK
jgi:HlyD family secretion protein